MEGDMVRSTAELRPHPENAVIFGGPEECAEWPTVLASIRRRGILEPIVIKADGTILSGHLRHAAAVMLKLATVPVRIAPPFGSYREELEFVIRSNTDRRQLTKQQIAFAFKRLRETPKAEGGTKGRRGRPEKRPNNPPPRRGISRDPAADEAASVLGVSADEGRRLEKVFATPGVPDELKHAVNTGKVAPTPAARAVASEAKRQGGRITDPAALRLVAKPPEKPAEIAPITTDDHAARVEEEAARYAQDFRELLDVYQRLDRILTRRPLKSLLGPTEHHEYGDLLRDIAIRTWREVEAVQGATNAGRQMTLAVIPGGRS